VQGTGLILTMTRRLISVDGVILALAASHSLTAQQTPSAEASSIAKDVANSNNPLASLNAINLQDYYDPSLYSIPNSVGNTMMLRGAIVSGRQIIRATLPIATLPSGYEVYDLLPPPNPNDTESLDRIPPTPALTSPTPVVSLQYASGLGDFNIFDMIKLNSDSAPTQYALGPLFVAPTATDKALGSGKWQAGAAAAAIHPLAMGSMLGVLVTWQHSFAGQQARPHTNLFTCQPVGTFSIGGGYYIRSSGVLTFDAANGRYLIPLGVGVGKVFKAGRAIANAFIEPQFSVYHQGIGQPTIQLYAGINLQWSKKSK
jgi:hypothetical protein